MIKEIKKEMKELKITAAVLRNFGFVLFVLFAVWAWFFVSQNNPHWVWPAFAGACFLLAGLLFQSILRQPYRLWMYMAFVMSWFMTRLILAVAYLVIITPVGWLLKISGKDVLDERISRDAVSYWKRHETAVDRERYKKQY